MTNPLLGGGLDDFKSGILNVSGAGEGALTKPVLGASLDDFKSGILDSSGEGEES